MPDSVLPPDDPPPPVTPSEATVVPAAPSEPSPLPGEELPAPAVVQLSENTANETSPPEESTPTPEPEPAEVAAEVDEPAEAEADEPAEAEVNEPAEAEVGEPATPAEPETNKRWYVVKVQSGREESIKEAIERRVKIEALEEFYGEIVIPTETVVEMRRNKRVKKEKKLYPGYLMAFVEYNDRILYLFRETSGVGDFVGGTITRPPPPMSQREIDAMLRKNKPDTEGPKVMPTKPEFSAGDRVKVKDGAFAGMEGEVKEILEAKGQVRVEVAIFGRPVSLELEYWQVEQV
jgi:transcription termination/antitermination protein NusG